MVGKTFIYSTMQRLSARKMCRCMIALFILSISMIQPLHASVSVDLTPQEIAFLQQHSRFRAHVEHDYSPFIYVENGEAHGFTVEFTNLLAKRLGITIDYVVDESWDDALVNLKNRQIDLVVAMVNNAQRQQYTCFTEPVLINYTGLATRKNDLFGNTLDEFDGRRVAVVDGYWHLSVLQQYYPQIIPVTYPDNIACLEALANKDVDAVLSTNPVLAYQIRNRFMVGLQTKPLLASNYFHSTDECYGVRIDYPLLASALQKAIDSVAEEELNALRRRWLIDAVETKGLLVLSEKERQHLMKMKELRLCVDPAWMPLEGIDNNGKHTGLSADYFAKLQQLLPVPIRLVPTANWQETLDKAKNGECDLVSLITKTEERGKYLNFTKPYLNLPVVIATREDEIFIENIQQVADKRFGGTKGYSVTELFRQQYPAIELIETDNVASGIQMVHRGEIYGFIGSVATLGQEIRDQGLDDVKISGRVDISHNLRVGVRKDDPLLLNIMERAVVTMGGDEGKRLYNKWLPVSYRPGVDLRFVLLAVLFAGIVIVLMVMRNRRLTQLNQKLTDAHLQLEEKSRELEFLSITDRLTGLYNRFKIDKTVSYEWARVQRYEQSLSLIMLDLDHFKSVNDNFGHQQGDVVLCAVAECLRTRVRQADVVGRWGGEEFMIVCPATSLSEAQVLAEALRAEIEQIDLTPIPVQTASFGVATFHDGDDSSDTLRRADKALYRAKELGRNRVVTENE